MEQGEGIGQEDAYQSNARIDITCGMCGGFTYLSDVFIIFITNYMGWLNKRIEND